MDLFKTKSQDALSLRQQAENAASQFEFLMARADKAVASILYGEHRQRKSGAGERFWQFREYYPGDRPQDIDWRQSGKTDRVFIRQKEWQTNQSAYVWCSRARSMDFKSEERLPTKAEAAKILTLAVSILLSHAGEDVGTFGTPQKGRSQLALQAITERLLEPDLNDDRLPHGDVARHASLFFTGDFLEPLDEIERNFKNIAAQADSGFVIQILDPAEIEIPYNGRVLFEKPGDKQRELINNVASIREEYNRRIAAHIEGIKKICRACEWHYVLHSTDRDITNTLLEIWQILTVHSQRAGTLQR